MHHQHILGHVEILIKLLLCCFHFTAGRRNSKPFLGSFFPKKKEITLSSILSTAVERWEAPCSAVGWVSRIAISVIWWPVCACVWQIFYGVKRATRDKCNCIVHWKIQWATCIHSWFHPFIIHPLIHLCIHQWIHVELFQCTSVIFVIHVRIITYIDIYIYKYTYMFDYHLGLVFVP